MRRGDIVRRPVLIGTALALLGLGACGRGPNELPAPVTLSITSPGITAGVLDKDHTCASKGISPALLWSAPPRGTRTLALTVTDLDSLFGYRFVHWVLYDMPATERELPAGFAGGQRPGPAGIERGRNDDGHEGYVPPCPPGGRTHRYGFVLYALDTAVNRAGLSKAALLAAIRGHILAKGELVGRGSR